LSAQFLIKFFILQSCQVEGVELVHRDSKGYWWYHKKRDAINAVPLELDGRFYYRSKTLAKQSAAMETLKRYNVLIEGLAAHTVAWLLPPYNKLPLLYKKDRKIDLTDEMLTIRTKTMSGSLSGGKWWTTSFVCPVSGQVFHFGELPGDEVVHRDSEGYWWYGKRRDANNAAVGNALDTNNLQAAK
jgi:hypothetical protein